MTNLPIDEQICRIAKGRLRSANGLDYLEFKRGLRPRYFIVWRDIFMGHLALAVSIAVLMQVQRAGLWVEIAVIPGAAIVFGFVFAYLNLFLHEAAHKNIAADERWNDLLGDWLIGAFFGQSTKAYRVVHFGHHQYHGTTMDTEHSYFDVLNMRFIAGALLGIRAFHVARKRHAVTSSSEQLPRRVSRNALLRGLILNGAITGGFFFAGYWSISIAWALGLLSVYPFFNALRQLLEHRDEHAREDVNYCEVAHGRINRLFGDSLLAQTLGGAGFNRHLLHHWEPLVSYTRLKELEDFVMACDCAPLFRQRQTTYTRVFCHFLKWRHR